MKSFLLLLSMFFLNSNLILAFSNECINSSANELLPDHKTAGITEPDLLKEHTVSDCQINSVVADVTTCENGLFNVLINFVHEATSDSFRINGNGVMYGHFAYADLPVLLEGLSANCETNYEFGIRDLEYEDCHSATGLGVVCCEGDCQISNLELATSDCSENNHHALTIDFDVENPGNAYFNVWVNSVYRGSYLISALPLTLTMENTTQAYDHVLVCINDVDDCCIDGNIANPCYIVENCNISDVTADVTTCENGLFNVLINFEHEATSDSFRINGNGVMYGHFAYADLPVLLEGLSANCETNYEFGVADLEYEGCHSDMSLGVVCCEGDCQISNLDLATSDCSENNHHALTIDFEVENPGNAYFNVWVNSVYRGYFLISALPLTLTMENTTQAYDHVLVCINDIDDCCIDGNIANPCYIVENCHISNVTADVTTCENGLFNVLINFEHEATSDSFRINGNGVMYGHFAYADLPVLLEGLAANCETNYEFVIRDLEHEDCHSATGLGVVCCEGDCEISNLELATSDCSENDHHTLTIDFDVENPGNAYFNVWVNSLYRGYYLISALPLTLTMENTTQAYDHVLVCINDVDGCCIDGNIVNPCYIVENCHISNATADVTICENGVFNVLINFEHEATSDSFRINGNGVMYGHFAYADLPVLLEGLAANCETNYEFGIRDLEFEGCHTGAELGVVCCEGDCTITDLSLTASECNSDEDYLLTIDFNYSNPGNDLFELWFNGWYIGNFNLNALPFTLTFENSGFQADTVVVCINDQEDCCAEGIVNNPCNPSDICNIFELGATVMACENDLFNVEIDFNHHNTSESFKIQGNGVNYGDFSYSDLPVLLEGLNADCETPYEFDIIDLGKESCRKSTQVGKVCCSTTDNTNTSSPSGNYYYSLESNRLNMDFKENLYDEVIVTFYNLLGQKVDQVKLQQVSGAKYLEVLSEDYIQLGKIDLFRNGKLAGSETVKIMKLR